MNLLWDFVGGRPTMFDWAFKESPKGDAKLWFNIMIGLVAVYIVVSVVLPNKAK